MSDSIGYEIFREAGVPAPRTAYAWLTVSVEGRWENRPLGIYLMVEPVDKAFMQERFGNKDMPVFKPVTYELFNDLGDDWSAYAPIYDLKTEATEGERRRLIELARLVTSATDAEFQTQIVDLVDLDLFARFLACEVLLANYDSILTTGQNFYLCLDMRSNKFVFVPWDLDAAWGNLWIGTKEEQERGSIWHPWVGENRFLERLMAAEAFRQLYRDRLEEFLSGIFQTERLQRRVETLAAFLRGPIGAESGFRSNKFEQEVAAKPVTPSPGETRDGINRPAYPVKKFVENRVKSVREQLDGKSEGLILKPPALR
jgi:spore coat protein CotH